jgi:hypothetical protein
MEDFFETIPETTYAETQLGSKEPGSTVKICGKNFTVLSHNFGWTTVIRERGEGYRCVSLDEADYESSEIRDYLNNSYYGWLCAKIGAENIRLHATDCTALDGTCRKYVEDYVSLITLDQYREYGRLIKDENEWYWTATRSSEMKQYSMLRVNGDGTIDTESCDADHGGVHPLVIIKSSIEVE